MTFNPTGNPSLGASPCHSGHVQSSRRWELLGQRPVTIWLTGLSAAGKSTLAYTMESVLIDADKAAYVLDGDNVRHGLNKDLGFSHEARSENIRRIAEVARLMNDSGLIVITAFISPYREDRQMARNIIGPGNFFEVHVDTALHICEDRDPKGMYQRARVGEIQNFTGVNAPYEPPVCPDLRIETSINSPLACALQVLAAVTNKIS